ncbi:MAG: hypothetical protein E5Y60_11365 [Mesorhizobium sp.]|nr:MAG: hypothetical protein E5Y60_11365 [Mesorhizobium sp.]
MAEIKGILFDKDGTLVDFNATWLGVADFMAMDAAEGDRWKADRLLAAAGYDFATKRFKPDSIFASGTNMDVVELWFPRLSDEDQMLAVARFNEITSVQGSSMAVALPGIVAGSIFTFSLTLGDYIIPQIIGTSRLFIGQAVYSQQGTAGNIPLAAAFTVVPIVIMGFYLWGAKRMGAFDAL